MSKLQVKINSRPTDLRQDIFVYRELVDGDIENLEIKGDKVDGVIHKRNSGAVIKPLFTMHYHDVRDFVAGIQQVAQEMHLPEPTKEYAQGKLEATERHLGDMHRFVFGKVDIVDVKKRAAKLGAEPKL